VRYLPCAGGKDDARSLKYWVSRVSAGASVTDTSLNSGIPLGYVEAARPRLVDWML